MQTNWAADHLQVIRTLMERSALYRRALAPIMIFNGLVGLVAGGTCWFMGIHTPGRFVACWFGAAVVAVAGSFLLVRRQALKDAEPFWSPPTRRVAQALATPLVVGAFGGVLTLAWPDTSLVPSTALPGFWMLLYGCALASAGFFMPRGIKLLGWIFVACGGSFLLVQASGRILPTLAGCNLVMGAAFGGVHLAYGVYLYFTEPRRTAS